MDGHDGNNCRFPSCLTKEPKFRLLNMGVKAVLYFCVSVKGLLGFGWLFWVQRGPRCDKHCNDISLSIAHQ
jgi:hypothetical protein